MLRCGKQRAAGLGECNQPSAPQRRAATRAWHQQRVRRASHKSTVAIARQRPQRAPVNVKMCARTPWHLRAAHVPPQMRCMRSRAAALRRAASRNCPAPAADASTTATCEGLRARCARRGQRLCTRRRVRSQRRATPPQQQPQQARPLRNALLRAAAMSAAFRCAARAASAPSASPARLRVCWSRAAPAPPCRSAAAQR